MKEWLASLGVLGQIYFWVAIAATAFLIVQIVMMLCSFGGADGDLDLDGDGLPDGFDGDADASGVGFFTLKGLTAFFTLGAWVGLLCETTFPEELKTLSLLPAFLAGAAAMVAMTFAMRGMLKLQESGNLQKENLIGKSATVYISIQPGRKGTGKITLTAQGQYTELNAVTDEAEKIGVNETVYITEYSNGTAVVMRHPAEK